MNELSKNTQNVLLAFRKGYRVTASGEVESASGRIRKLSQTKWGHYTFTVGIPKSGRTGHVLVHRLAAYQKFGDAFLEAECVRHLDGCPTNNRADNIAIGTHSDNMMDIDAQVRMDKARHATSFIRRTDWDIIDKDRAAGMSYRDLSKKYSMSKGTLSFHYNNSVKDPKPEAA
jgi:hypothetical protein